MGIAIVAESLGVSCHCLPLVFSFTDPFLHLFLPHPLTQIPRRVIVSMRQWTFGLWLLPSLLRVAWADTKTDSSRLGTEYTLMPLHRGEGGTNVLTLGIGTPVQDFNLTLCQLHLMLRPS